MRGPGGEESRARMTLRVSRDSGRTWSVRCEVRDISPLTILANPVRFPPCECARCLGPGSARALRPVVVTPGATKWMPQGGGSSAS